MELRHLRYFIAVATELHFGRAAAKLNIAQPPLSQQIRQLEDELGTQLLARTKRRVQLTQPGRTFLREAQAIIAHADDAVAKTRRADRGETGHLSIGWVPWSDWTELPHRVNKFCLLNREVHIDIHNLNATEQIAALHSGLIDVGFVLRPLDESAPFDIGPLKNEIVLRHPLVAVLPRAHKLASTRYIQFSAFAAEPYITFKRDSAPVFYDSVIRLFQRRGFLLNVRHEADHFSTVLGLVAAGLGVSLLPFGGGHAITGVRYRALLPRLPTVDIALAWREENQSALLEKFLKAMQR
ncbi:MAG TPA: LysR substrate-binding domain-containing protein [Candidatus Binatia bacterium]|nr:LysR substrate-binding domain-containing protein [Candidatus Binatia bacterium]